MQKSSDLRKILILIKLFAIKFFPTTARTNFLKMVSFKFFADRIILFIS